MSFLFKLPILKRKKIWDTFEGYKKKMHIAQPI